MEWVTTNKPYVVFSCGDLSFFKFQSLHSNIKRASLSIYHTFNKNRYSKILFINNSSCGIDKQKDVVNKKLSLSFLRAKNKRMPFISNRLPGMLSNYVSTIRFYKRRKINFNRLTKNRFYMHKNRKGFSRLTKSPSIAIFFSPYGRFADAVREASSLGVPTVGIMNSNSDFSTSDSFISGNDNSYISILYSFRLFNEAILRGYRANLLCESMLFSIRRRIRKVRRVKRRHKYHHKPIMRYKRVKIRRKLRRLRRIFRCTNTLRYGRFVRKIRKVLKTLKYFFVRLKSISSFNRRRLKPKKRYFIRKRIKRRKNFFFRDENFYYRRYYRRHRLVDELRRYIRVTIFERQFHREAWRKKIKLRCGKIIRYLRASYKKKDNPLRKYLYFVLSRRRKLFPKQRTKYQYFKSFFKRNYFGHQSRRVSFKETIYGKFVWFVYNYDPVRSRRRGFPKSWKNKRHNFFKRKVRLVRKDRRFKNPNKFAIKSTFYSFYYLYSAKKLLYNGPIPLRYH